MVRMPSRHPTARTPLRLVRKARTVERCARGPRRSALGAPRSATNKMEYTMSTISAAAVNALRQRTNAPMMECKAALTEANGDMEAAIDILRKKNSAIQAKKGERET